MNKTLYILAFFLTLVPLRVQAQQILTDHEWYVAGEDMLISVETTDRQSVLAYAELCDAKAMQATASLSLKDGIGNGIMELPRSLHSGIYTLCIYTPGTDQVVTKAISIVNTLFASADDDIEWVDISATPDAASAGQTNTVSTLTMKTIDGNGSNIGVPVYARIHLPSPDTTVTPLLSVVGKQVHVFEGEFINDSTAVFLTYGVNGRQPIVVSATTQENEYIPVDIISPYANLATRLPQQDRHLVFRYNRAEVEQRSMAMQQILRNDTVIPMPFDNKVFSTEPALSYNLDEYRPFASLREVLTEYVSNVHRTTVNDREYIYVFNQQNGYGDWPAMVLIDGMPVTDIERLLRYDARRINHILIYDDRYTFGNRIYCGILSIVTRTGQLTNFPPSDGASYLLYEFPY